MINRVILVGNLTRDPESTTGPATTLTRMRIATNVVWRDADGSRQESAEFHNVVAYGKLGEICASYCLKGRRVYIEGRLRTREYDGSDGLRRHTTEVVAETMKLLDRPPVAGDGSNGGDGNAVGDDVAAPESAAEGDREVSGREARRREHAPAAPAS